MAVALPREQKALKDLEELCLPKLKTAGEKFCPQEFRAEALGLLQALGDGQILKRARTILWSRGFTLCMGSGRIVALVPLLDMMDHSPSARVTWLTEEQHGYVRFIADDAIQCGNEVHNNYGQKPNEELLVGYGFALLQNPAERFHVRLAVSSAEDNNGTVKARQKALHLLGLSFDHELSVLKPLPEALLASARICLMDECTIYSLEWQPKSGERDVFFNEKNIALEWRVLSTLRKLLCGRVSNFAGGEYIDADNQLLEELTNKLASGLQNLEGNVNTLEGDLMCLRFRIGQKEIAMAALEAICVCALKLLPVAALSEPVEDFLPRGVLQFVYSPFCSMRTVKSPVLQLVDNCSRGKPLVRIPTSEILSLNTALIAQNPLAIALQQVGGVPEILQLQMLLMWERNCGVDSLWSPIIRRFSCMEETGQVWRSEEISELLEGTGLGERMEEQVAEMEEQFTFLQKLLQSEVFQKYSQVMTWANFCQTQALLQLYGRSVTTANFHKSEVEGNVSKCEESKKGSLVLAPFLSWIPSHLLGIVVEPLFEEDASHLVLKAVCDLKKGSILEDATTGVDNETRCLQFSPKFMDLNNPFDFIEIALAPPSDDPLIDVKECLLEVSGVGKVHFLSLPPSPLRLMAAMGICSLESESDMDAVGVSSFLVQMEAENMKVEKANAEHPDQSKEEGGEELSRGFVSQLMNQSRKKKARVALRRLLLALKKGFSGGDVEKDKRLWEEMGEEDIKEVVAGKEESTTGGVTGSVCKLGVDVDFIENEKEFNAVEGLKEKVNGEHGCSQESETLRFFIRKALAYRYGQKKILEAWLEALKLESGDLKRGVASKDLKVVDKRKRMV